eukprot:Skav221771  [mRNA]  locus=scaffold490:466928:467587:- [translate_table: standard]
MVHRPPMSASKDSDGISTSKDFTDESMLEVVQSILDRSSLALINHRGCGGETALIRACSEHLSKCVNALIAAKSQVNLADSEGKTALHHCAMKPRCHKLVTELLQARAAVDQKGPQSWTPLMFAVQKANFQGVELLLKARASVQSASRDDSIQVFRCAVENCCTAHSAESGRKVLGELIGSDCNLFEDCKEELMEIAAEEANTDMYHFLESFSSKRRRS